MENKYILDSERKIRLSMDDKYKLYYLLLSESGLKEAYSDCVERLTAYCEKLAWKYVVGEELESICPKCYRICNLTNTVHIFYTEDFGIEVPKIEKVKSIDDIISISFVNQIPNVLEEGAPWSRHMNNYFNDKRFSAIVKKLATETEKKTLINLLSETLSANIEVNSFLKDLSTPARARWRGYEVFGNFFNLGALLDYNREYAIRMKYDILHIVDPVVEDVNGEVVQTFDKNPAEFPVEQNVERLRQILNI